jgi:hypothetical protein
VKFWIVAFLILDLSTAFGQSSTLYLGEMIPDPYKECSDGRIVQVGPYKIQQFTSYTGSDLSGRTITPKVKLKLKKGEYINQAFLFGGVSGMSKRTQFCLNFRNSPYTCIDGDKNMSKIFYFSSHFCSSLGCLNPIRASVDNYEVDMSLGFTGDEDIGNGNRIDWPLVDANALVPNWFVGKASALVCIRKL